MNKLCWISLSGLLFFVFLSACEQPPVVTVRSLEDLDQLTVGVPRGTTHEMYVMQHTHAVLKSYDATTEVVQALCSGKVDAAVTNRPVGNKAVRECSCLYLSELDMGKDSVGIAICKGDSLLRDSINKVISDLKEAGILEEMEKRWLSFTGACDQPGCDAVDVSRSDSPKGRSASDDGERLYPAGGIELSAGSASYLPPGIDPSAAGHPLRVAISATREPFCFRNASGNLCGYDVELACRIASRLQRPLKFRDMNFSALIAALLSGKADVVISLLNITPERLQAVDFSLSYYESGRVLILRKKEKPFSCSL